MKKTIWMKILLFAIIPFLAIYIVLAGMIINSVFQDKLEQVEMEVKSTALFTAENFQEFMRNMRLSVMFAAARLENINPQSPDARKQGEDVIFGCFANNSVFNAWLVFEPNAFDGRDAEHKNDYPGSPSGRYMRSYVRKEGGGYEMAPDMDETTLDDMDIAYWYLVPKLQERPYIDINLGDEIFYDYKTGEPPLNTITFAVPVFRDGTVIGCVGADILLSDSILGSNKLSEGSAALFLPSGILRHFADISLVGKHIEELGFKSASGILTAFKLLTPIFLNEYSPLIKDRAYHYFTPVSLDIFNETAYVYYAVSENFVMKARFSVLRPVAITLIIVLIMFGALLFYLVRTISKPVQELTSTCEAISRGNLDKEIPLSHAKDEIGVMARSLHRMVEQFRVYISLQERAKKLLDIYTRLHTAMYENDQLQDVFDATIAVICDHFKVYKASLVFITEGMARVLSRYKAGLGLSKGNPAEAADFLHHREVTAVLADRKYVYLNAFSIVEQKITFLENTSTCLCILPILSGETLRGYILMEGDETTGPIVNDDSALIFISDTISYILTKKETYVEKTYLTETGASTQEEGDLSGLVNEEPAPANVSPGNQVLQAAKGIEELNVDRGLFLIGGMEDQYVDLLRISAKVFDEGLRKMRALVSTDIPAFAIEVHGMKGALYNIGADGLGDGAKKLEFAAKGADAAYCEQAYPDFEAKLSAFARKLDSATAEDPVEKTGGDIRALSEALPDALEACKNFDSLLALKIIGSFTRFTYEGAQYIEESLQKITEALENIDYEEALTLITDLLSSLSSGANGKTS
ncbi:MAG: HAMP domain-containing protein [Spirochaetales bacterium]|jgi:HAMP domain-containing protein|nr:HAMP domain-containing protein [Spirochaetales bacterium]